MWRLKRCLTSLLLLALLCWQPSVGLCSYQVTDEQLQTLGDNLNMLKENNERLQMLLTQSEKELRTAKAQSSLSASRLTELNARLTESRKQIDILQSQLMTLQQQSDQVKMSLEKAQNSLNQAQKSYETSKKGHARTERRLKLERTLWQVATAALLVKSL